VDVKREEREKEKGEEKKTKEKKYSECVDCIFYEFAFFL